MKYLQTCLLIFVFSTIVNSQPKIYTCINEKGEKLFSVKANYVGSFHNGLAEIQKVILIDNKPVYRYGFIDGTGKTVIELKYEKVYTFSSGVCWVKSPGDEGYHLINLKGERLTPTSWKKVGFFIEGFCDVYDEEGKMGFINRDGKLVIPIEYLGTSFSEGYACVMPYHFKEERYGFIDTNGKVVIPFQYKQPGTSSFENGECRVQINGVTCLINKKGEVVFKPTLTKNTMGFSNGLSASYTKYETRGGWGFYNRKNVWVIKPQYDNATSFDHGYSIVEKAGKYGVIDTTGKIIIPVKYESLFGNAVTNGYFGVELIMNKEKQYIKADGSPFTKVPMKYLFPANGHSLLPYCDPENKYGYLTKSGEIFIKAEFDQTNTFYEGKSWIKGNTGSLKTAEGVSPESFVTEFKAGEKIMGNWQGKGTWYPGTIKEIGEHYYLILYDDGDQEWVVFDSIKRK